MSSVVAFDGTKVVLTQERLRHITHRHPEVKNITELVLDTVADPDEIYLDRRGAFHALKQTRTVSDFFVVIYKVNSEGYIRTAYYISNSRKVRRYRAFRKLKLS